MNINLELCKEISHMIKKAGEIFKDRLDSCGSIMKKGAANYVTEIDYRVQDYLVRELNRMMPGCNIITEETEDNIFKFDKPTWIIDPVDGTTNLMYGYNHSAISMALIDNSVLKAAFIYNPFSEELFHAALGEGAYLNGNRIKASCRDSLQECLVAFGTTPYDRKNAHKTFEITEKVFMECCEIRRSGAASLDLAYVAAGRIDAFYEMCLQPWDYAAGILIVAEAGGIATNWNGDSLDVRKPESVLATNGRIHNTMLAMLA